MSEIVPTFEIPLSWISTTPYVDRARCGRPRIATTYVCHTVCISIYAVTALASAKGKAPKACAITMGSDTCLHVSTFTGFDHKYQRPGCRESAGPGVSVHCASSPTPTRTTAR